MNKVDLTSINKKRRDAGLSNSKPQYNLIKRFRDKNTRKNAIYAFCFNCMGGTDEHMPDPGYRTLIKECTDIRCPLYSYRPFV